MTHGLGWGKVGAGRGKGRSADHLPKGGRGDRSWNDGKPPMTKDAGSTVGIQKYAPGDGGVR